MLKKVGPLLLFSLFLITACTSGGSVLAFFEDLIAPANPVASTEPAPPPFLNTMPAGNGLVFLGFAEKVSDPKETILLALLDAAQRVSAFNTVYGEFGSEINIGSSTFDYVHNTYTSLDYDQDEKTIKRHFDAFRFDPDTHTMEIETTLIVRATYPASLPNPIPYYPTYDRTGKPDWVKKTPQFNGYEIGVGYSNRYSSLTDTYTNSYNNAIFSIIRKIHTHAKGSNTIYWTDASLFGYRTDSNNVNYSYGTLKGFHVLDTWIDPKAKTVWTLAIARKE